MVDVMGRIDLLCNRLLECSIEPRILIIGKGIYKHLIKQLQDTQRKSNDSLIEYRGMEVLVPERNDNDYILRVV